MTVTCVGTPRHTHVQWPAPLMKSSLPRPLRQGRHLPDRARRTAPFITGSCRVPILRRQLGLWTVSETTMEFAWTSICNCNARFVACPCALDYPVLHWPIRFGPGRPLLVLDANSTPQA